MGGTVIMRSTCRLGGAAAAVFLAVLLGAPAPAAAQVQTDFASCAADLAVCDANHEDCCVRAFDPIASDRAVVIPMDRCHQVVAQSGKLAPPTVAAAWCSNPGPFSSNDNGMYVAYGLVFRLMQNGIPVYWVINPTKEPPALTQNENLNAQSYANKDVDTWIVSEGATPPSSSATALTACNGNCTAPVRLLDPATMAPTSTWSYSKREFPLRGGVFVIAPEDRARFNDFIRRQGEFAGFANNSNYDFSAVDMYEVQNGARFVYQDFRTGAPYTLGNGGNGAPVAVRIDYAPPRLARLAPAGVSQTWLTLAKLNVPANYPECKTGNFAPADAVFCDISKTDIGNNALVAGDFDWAWIDNWNAGGSPCSDPAERDQVDKLRAFLTAQTGVRAGGHVVFMESIIELLERCQDRQPMGTPGTVGLVADNNAPAEPLILRRPHNVFMQWGDLPTSFAQGAVTRWRYHGGGATGYAAGHLDGSTGTLVRLVSEDRLASNNSVCSRHRSTGACDVFAQSADADYYDVAAYLRFEDNPENGIVFYMPGNQVNNGPSHLRMVLNTLISMPLATVPQLPDSTSHEVARSAPVVGMFGGVETAYHGSFTLLDPPPVIPVYEDSSDDSTFEFPYSKGHYRGTEVLTGDAIFDAAEHIPPATAGGCGTWFSASCRTVFTNLATGRNPDRTFISTASRSMLAPQLAAIGNPLTDDEANTLISRILAGDRQDDGTWRPALGGIDRSSSAVIEPSPLIRNQRPTMAYVGGLDGMLHAFCIDVTGPCTAAGQELWAFVPRVLLPRLRLNDGRLDGSPKVADVFGDYDGDGRREWKTVLTFQVGSGQPGVTGFSPAVYALDVSNPASPQILWEVVPPATRGASEIGVGVSLAMAPTQTATGLRNYTYVVTGNGGTGSAGLHVTAISTESGAVAWTWTHTYPDARIGSNPPVPASGIPGGPVAIDKNQSGLASWIAVPSLYGEVWLLNAATGTSVYGTAPLFRFGSDFHPVGASPTLYRDGGGRLNLVLGSGGYVDPVSTSWSPDAVNQWLVSVAVEPISTPVSEASAAPDVAFAVDLGIGERVYSQAVVAGGELYVTTDRTDVNDTSYGLEADTGRLHRILLSTGTVRDSRTIHSGAASADAGGGKAYTADDVGVIGADYTADFDAVGAGTEFSMISSTGAKLWLRIE